MLMKLTNVQLISPEIAMLYEVNVTSNLGLFGTQTFTGTDGSPSDGDGKQDGVFSFTINENNLHESTRFKVKKKVGNTSVTVLDYEYFNRDKQLLHIDKSDVYHSPVSDFVSNDLLVRFATSDGIQSLTKYASKASGYIKSGGAEAFPLGDKSISWLAVEKVLERAVGGMPELQKAYEFHLLDKLVADFDLKSRLSAYQSQLMDARLQIKNSVDAGFAVTEAKYLANRDVADFAIRAAKLGDGNKITIESIKNYLVSIKNSFLPLSINIGSELTDLLNSAPPEFFTDTPNYAGIKKVTSADRSPASGVSMQDSLNVASLELATSDQDIELGKSGLPPLLIPEFEFLKNWDEFNAYASDNQYDSIIFWMTIAFLRGGISVDPASFKTSIDAARVLNEHALDIVNNSIVWFIGGKEIKEQEQALELLKKFTNIHFLKPLAETTKGNFDFKKMEEDAKKVFNFSSSVLLRYANEAPHVLEKAVAVYSRLATPEETDALTSEIRERISFEENFNSNFTPMFAEWVKRDLKKDEVKDILDRLKRGLESLSSLVIPNESPSTRSISSASGVDGWQIIQAVDEVFLRILVGTARLANVKSAFAKYQRNPNRESFSWIIDNIVDKMMLSNGLMDFFERFPIKRDGMHFLVSTCVVVSTSLNSINGGDKGFTPTRIGRTVANSLYLLGLHGVYATEFLGRRVVKAAEWVRLTEKAIFKEGQTAMEYMLLGNALIKAKDTVRGQKYLKFARELREAAVRAGEEAMQVADFGTVTPETARRFTQEFMDDVVRPGWLAKGKTILPNIFYAGDVASGVSALIEESKNINEKGPRSDRLIGLIGGATNTLAGLAGLFWKRGNPSGGVASIIGYLSKVGGILMFISFCIRGFGYNGEARR